MSFTRFIRFGMFRPVLRGRFCRRHAYEQIVTLDTSPLWRSEHKQGCTFHSIFHSFCRYQFDLSSSSPSNRVRPPSAIGIFQSRPLSSYSRAFLFGLLEHVHRVLPDARAEIDFSVLAQHALIARGLRVPVQKVCARAFHIV